MAALIGALRATLSADTGNFEAGMRRARSTAVSTGAGIKKALSEHELGIASFGKGLLAALSVGALSGLIKSSLEYAGSLQEVATQVGVTAKELQTLRYVASQQGVSSEQLEKSMSKLTVSMSKASAGSEQTQKAFKAVGVTLDDINTKSKSEILGQIADHMVKTGGAAKNAAAGVAIMSRGFLSMAPILDLGSKGINQLSQAAEKLGIVLSDEQIAKADETADRIEALKTVLSANIAGVVADNADSILTLANALATLVGSIGDAIRGWKVLVAEFEGGLTGAAAGFVTGGIGGAIAGYQQGADRAGALARAGVTDAAGSVTVKLPPATRKPKGPPDIDQFLAKSGGKGKKSKEDHSAEKALRESYQFNQELDRAQQDILHAQQDLARDYIERTSIGIQILNAEKAAYEAELQYQVSLGKLTAGKEGLTEVQAAQLRAAYDSKDHLERQKLLDDEQEQRQQDVQELTEHDYDRRRDILESQAQIAETASERRKVELELLELAYESKRQALQNIIDTSKDDKAIEDARRDLLNLNKTYGNDRQGVLNSTRGPLEDYLASLPDTADKVNEAMQSLEVQGFQGLIDSALALKDGFGAAKKSLLDTLAAFVQGILRMRLEAGLAGAVKGGGIGGFFNAFLGISKAVSGGVNVGNAMDFGGSFGAIANAPLHFARGGGFTIRGRGGTDRNMLSLNGLPIANVSHGERISIANDNVNSGRPYFDLRGAVMTQDLLAQMNQIGEVSTGRGAILGAAGAEERGARRSRMSIP